MTEEADFLTPRSVIEDEEEPEACFSTPGRHARALAAAESIQHPEEENQQEVAPSRKLLDPVMLDAIETETKSMAHNIVNLLTETKERLGTASAISAQCAEAYNDATTDLGDSVDKAVASMDSMLEECSKLEATFDNMDACAARLKELRAETDAFEAMWKRAQAKGLLQPRQHVK